MTRRSSCWRALLPGALLVGSLGLASAAPSPLQTGAPAGHNPPPGARPDPAPAAAPDKTAPDKGTPDAKPGGEPKPGDETKPAQGTKPAEGTKPVEEPKPGLQQGPPLAVTGVRDVEMLPRDFEASLRFYVEVLGFHEEEASGGEGERRSVLVSGPVRITLREQRGKPAQPARPPWLGVNPAPLSEITAENAGMKEPKGVLVDDIVPQGPAAAAGIVKGDIILAVEGKETESPDALTARIREFDPGKKVLVTLWRERKKQEIPVTLPACPFPDRLAPVILHLEVRDLDGYYREVLKRGLRIYAAPRDAPGGGRVMEIVDPSDVLVVLDQPAGAAGPEEKPAAGEENPAPDAEPKPGAAPKPGEKPAPGGEPKPAPGGEPTKREA